MRCNNAPLFKYKQVGDVVVLEPEGVRFEVVAKRVYADFKSMIKVEGVHNVVPDKQEIDLY